MAFDPGQLGMAIFLLVAACFNAWFVTTSARRAFSRKEGGSSKPESSPSYRLLSRAVFVMAAFDVPWVWLCCVQCWNNAFRQDAFNQSYSGVDGLGCRFMGWYSTFSWIAMMGSHCLVARYLLNHLGEASEAGRTKTGDFLNSRRGLPLLSAFLLLLACLLASRPLMPGSSGYALTTGGFCYADFASAGQGAMILSFTLLFLLLSTRIWCRVGRWREYWCYYAAFAATWTLWVPASAYGVATGGEIPYPYMLIGAIVGHANAVVNPLLYGRDLFKKLRAGEGIDVGDDEGDREMRETPDIT